MTDPSDPWKPPPEQEPESGGGGWLWLACIAVVVSLVAVLAWRFPDAVASGDDWLPVVYLTLLLGLVSSGIVASRRGQLARSAKQALTWAGIALVLVLGYSFRAELGFVGGRVLGELLPDQGYRVGERAIGFRAGRDGHFRIEALVNGQAVRFLVDTGATAVVLSRPDAERLGLNPAELRYTLPVNTANGMVYAAPVRLERIEIDTLRIDDLPAIVNGAEMAGSSLLGMTFLSRLRSYEVRGGELVLRW